MSRYFLLPVFIFILSCGKQPAEEQGGLGIIRRFEPLVVTEGANLQKLRDMCQALSSRENILTVLSQSGTTYSYSYAQKDCDQGSLPAFRNISTTISKVDGSFYFRTTNGERFAFSEVDTTAKGSMARICQQIGYLMNPMLTSSTGAMWFTTVTSSEHCTTDTKGVCVHIQSGTAIDQVDYAIHTNEWIKFNVTDKKGFFVERKLISSAGCSKKKFIEMRAILK